MEQLDFVTPNGEKYGIVDGPFGSNLKTIHYRNSGVPIITSGYVTEGVFHADEYLYVDQELFEREKRSSVKGGDIVMAKIGARCGASAILPKDHQTGILSGNALKISVDETRHSNFYVWSWLWYLYQTRKIELLKTVGAQPAISMSSLKKYKLPIPPLPEQQKIAQILSTWDKAITKTEELIKQNQKRKQGLMQQLLTGKKRFREFDKSWQVLKVKEVADVDKESLGSNTATSYSFRYISLSDVEDGRVSNSLPTLEFGLAPSRARRIVKKGSVIMATVRPNLQGFAKIKSDENDLIASTGFAVLDVRENFSSNYLFHYLFSHHMTKQIDSLIVGSNYPAINSKEVKNLKINIPSYSEQQKIASVLSSADQEINSLQNQLGKLKEQKKGLMQKLLTGEVRVKID